MKTKKLLAPGCILLAGMLSCSGPAPQTLKENDGSVQQKEVAGNALTVCKFDNKKDTITIPLSEFVDDCQIIRFANTDPAYFRAWIITVSDNYIGVRQERAAYKLFDKQGKYLHDVGAFGNGPGEYAISIYDELIDEKGGRIFFTPFTGNKIMVYGLDGKWIKNIELPGKINKPKIAMNPDGTLSVVHMPFSEEEPFAFQIDTDGNILKQVPTASYMKVNTFDGEIFAPQNSGKLDFQHTSIDTIFRYDAAKNQLLPRFTMEFPDPENKPIHVYCDLPDYTFVNYFYWKDKYIPGGTLIVDKKKQSSAHVNLKNDFFGDLPISPNFNKGWFIQNIEPGNLIEKIEAHLASGKCPDKDKKKLQELAASLHENDNNVLFIGKLKQ